MSTINANVTRGYKFVYDASSVFQVTLDRLNLAAQPVVTVDLTSGVDTEDLVDSGVSAAKLSNDVADAVLTGAATVGAPVAATNPIEVSLQIKDIQGNALAQRSCVSWWLSDGLISSGNIPPTATIPDQTLVYTNGNSVVDIAASTVAIGVTDATGKLYLTFQHDAGALTRYFYCIVNGQLIAGSQALTWS